MPAGAPANAGRRFAGSGAPGLDARPIPKDPTLLGLRLHFQHAEVQGTTLSLGNGVTWNVGN